MSSLKAALLALERRRTRNDFTRPQAPTDFDHEDALAELDSDEGTNYGLPIAPLTREDTAVLALVYVQLN